LSREEIFFLQSAIGDAYGDIFVLASPNFNCRAQLNTPTLLVFFFVIE